MTRVLQAASKGTACFPLAFGVTEIPLSRCHCLLLPPSCCRGFVLLFLKHFMAVSFPLRSFKR